MRLNNGKRKISFLISLTLIFTFVVQAKAFAAGSSLRNASDLATHVFKGYNNGQPGPISITPVTLYKDGTQQVSAYLVGLSGTESVKNQSTGFWTDLKSGFELNSPYLLKLIDTINNNIPKNSNLIIAGHSLGGMIAQQAAGNSKIKDNYNVLNVVTFGSPLVNAFGREGAVQRLGDASDVVPYMSASGTMLLPWQVFGLNRENGGYWSPLAAHLESYKRSSVWGAYDSLGFKNGKSYINYDDSNIKFYAAPVN